MKGVWIPRLSGCTGAILRETVDKIGLCRVNLKAAFKCFLSTFFKCYTQFYLIKKFGLIKYYKPLKGFELSDYISLVNATAQISKI